MLPALMVAWAERFGPTTKREIPMFATFTPARETATSLIGAIITAILFVSSATTTLPIA